MIQQTKVSLTASDVTGQRRITVRDVPLDSTVGEVLDGMIPMMHLNRTGPDGRPLSVEARLDREGRHLARSERVQDALRHEDHLVLHPKIIAG